MPELRAYALPVVALQAAVGSTGPARERFRAIVRERLSAPPPTLLDRLGPIHRRVPGGVVVRDDDPSPDDLEGFLDGRPVRPERAAATWRIVEALAAGLASATVTATDQQVPAGVLAPLDLPVPPVDGLVVGWCPRDAARVVPALRTWVDSLPDLGPTAPDVLVVVAG